MEYFVYGLWVSVEPMDVNLLVTAVYPDNIDPLGFIIVTYLYLLKREEIGQELPIPPPAVVNPRPVDEVDRAGTREALPVWGPQLLRRRRDRHVSQPLLLGLSLVRHETRLRLACR